MSKNCLVLMISGSEVRQFGHSGMISGLIEKGIQVFVAARIEDQDLIDQLDKRVKFIPLSIENISPSLHRLQRIVDRIYEIRETKSGKSKWVDEWKAPSYSFKGKMNNIFITLIAQMGVHIQMVYELLLRYESLLESNQTPKEWATILRKHQIRCVILSTPRSELLQPILIAAKNLGIPRLLFFHSIKDISAKGRISHKFSVIGVWNEWMKNELLRRNKYFLTPSMIQITGCAHFDCVAREDIYIPEDQFRKMIGANTFTRLLLYPAAVPWVLPDQGRYIRMILDSIGKGKLPGDLQIVIRTNPMDLTDYFYENFKDNSQVIIQKSDWHMDKDRAWNFQRLTDNILYNSLLHYSTLCFGIPSTVTVECAISKLPVINIGFDLPDPKPPRSMKSFWNADFYQEEVKHKIATLCESEDDLINTVSLYLENGNKITQQEYENYFSEFLGILPHFSHKKYIDIIEKTIAAKGEHNSL